MKSSDIHRLFADTLITAEQRDRILNHYQIDKDGSRLLIALVSFGAILIAGGVALLVGSNWDAIPDVIKIATGMTLMLGAYGAGFYLREIKGTCPNSGEALYAVGAGLFLADIGLVGQIYNLSSRPSNAFLLWWIGIAALPWLLRSKALHTVSLVAFGIWFGVEITDRASQVHVAGPAAFAYLALLGLCYYALGYWLRATSYAAFATLTQQLGLTAALLFTYPLSLRFVDLTPTFPGTSLVLLAGMLLFLLLLAQHVILRDDRLTPQWRWTWLLTLGGLAIAVALQLPIAWWSGSAPSGYAAYAAAPRATFFGLVLILIAFVQIQVGVFHRAKAMINLGMVVIGMQIITLYLQLIESLATTGLMFVVSGLFLMTLGYYLEKKRRGLLQRMSAVPPLTHFTP